MARSISSSSLAHPVPWYGHVVIIGSLLGLAATVGCQRGRTWNLAPVEGTVTKDGRPLANIQVVFVADLDAGTQGPQSSGITDNAGHYRLRTDNGDDGAVVGKHRVLIRDNARKAAIKQSLSLSSRIEKKEATQRLSPEKTKRLEEQCMPYHYGHFKDTPLHMEVHPGSQTLDFDIPEE